MPSNEKGSRRRHAESNHVASSRSSTGGLLSTRNIVLAVFVILVLCSLQLFLFLSHTDPTLESHGHNIRVWHQLSVHEANLTALVYQQRDFAKLLGQLNQAVMEQQKELHDVENKMSDAGASARTASAPQREALLEAQRRQIESLQDAVEKMSRAQEEHLHQSQVQGGATRMTPQPEQVMHHGEAVDRSSLTADLQGQAESAKAADFTDSPIDPSIFGEFPKDWLNRFSQEDLESSAKEAEKWRRMAKAAAAHAWKGYHEKTWGKDEMKPSTGTPGRVWGNTGLQILDGLSTLWLMDLKEEFDQGAQWIETSLHFNHPSPVSFFEITIRALGGLCSAHSLSGRAIFLEKARELADKLLKGFNAQTGFPMTQVNLNTGAGVKGWYQGTVLAEAGTVQLEMRYMSQQTGDPKYAQAGDKSMRNIIEAEKGRGLVPWGLSSSSPPRFSNNHITFGAMGDSYYEYLLKMYLQTGSTEPEWKDAWRRAMDQMMERLIKTTNGGLTYIAEEKNGRIDHKMDHLACFVGGMLIYGARELKPNEIDSRWEKTAEGITETCYQMYHRQPSHLAPEASQFTTGAGQGQDMKVWSNAAHYLLRPEAAEAIFYMFYYTGDPKYRRWAGEIMEAIEAHCRTSYGYSAVADVRRETPSMRNEMETFFLAETLKYLYLTFVPNPRTVLNFDDFVLTTEAHPLRILKQTSNRFGQFLGH
eukprot:TRINITY_DN60760_c0_g1_i1.p1 TRINITY_DN60760_c0_g1~~TRINITY_DN60760_c0_g1_i1.p1  ORF type:complete len:703 (+),score=107.86 TRINITY_DN60760_c0_g1_i1:75-2183(+)